MSVITATSELSQASVARRELVLLGIPAALLVVGLVIRVIAYTLSYPDAPLTDFATVICRWDCEWYVRLAENGYDPFPTPKLLNAGNWAFFPLMPMLVGALRFVVDLPTPLLGMLTSLALTFGAVRLAWPLFDGNLRSYTLFATYLLAGPFAVYFTVFFTEAMFMLLTLGVFVALKRSDYLTAGLVAALLSATRIVGVFIVFAIVITAYLDYRKTGGRPLGFVAWALKRSDLVLAIFLAPLGLFLYMAFLHYWIGDGLAFSHVQRAWGRAYGNPILHLWSALSNSGGGFPSSSQLLGLAVIVGLGFTAVLALKRQFAAAVFCAICLVLPLFTGVASMTRFVAALAPIVVFAAVLVGQRTWSFALGMLGLLVGSYFVTVAWFTWSLALV